MQYYNVNLLFLKLEDFIQLLIPKECMWNNKVMAKIIVIKINYKK